MAKVYTLVWLLFQCWTIETLLVCFWQWDWSSSIRWWGAAILSRVCQSRSWLMQSNTLLQSMKQSQTSLLLSLAVSINHLMFAMWSLVPLCLRNPACSNESCSFRKFSSLFWRSLRRVLLVCEMRAIVLWFSHSLESPFFWQRDKNWLLPVLGPDVGWPDRLA